MKTINLIILSLILSLIISCQSEQENAKQSNEEQQLKEEQEDNTWTLTIEGDNIWVRDKPVRGKVLMKLFNGDECTVLEKGEPQRIRGNTDYWYKIKFKNQIGWVFGAQTSLKQTDSEPFDDFFDKFIVDIYNRDTIKIKEAISPIHGLAYTFTVCETSGLGVYEQVTESNFITEYYYKNSSIRNFIEHFENVSTIPNPNNNRESMKIDKIKDNLFEVLITNYGNEDTKFRFIFSEGEWYMKSVQSFNCFESMGV